MEHEHEKEIAKLKARIRDLEAAFGTGSDQLALAFKLPPQLKRVFTALLTMPAISSDVINERMGVESEARVLIQRLRKHLADWTKANSEEAIPVNVTRGLGYYLERDDKIRIKSLIQKYAADDVDATFFPSTDTIAQAL